MPKRLLLTLTAALLSGCAVKHIHVPKDHCFHVYGTGTSTAAGYEGQEGCRINLGDTGPVDIYVWKPKHP